MLMKEKNRLIYNGTAGEGLSEIFAGLVQMLSLRADRR